jgi:hypothetical protein
MGARLAVKAIALNLGAMLAVVALACGGDDQDQPGRAGDDPAVAASTVTTSGTATATPTVEQEVLAAYMRYSDAYKQALFDLDAKHVEGVATGEQLQRIRAEIDGLRAQGLAGRIEVTHKPVVIQVSGDTATLLDEMVNNSFYVDAKTKEPPVASGSGEILRDTFYLQRIGDKWMVTQSVRQKQGGQ